MKGKSVHQDEMNVEIQGDLIVSTYINMIKTIDLNFAMLNTAAYNVIEGFFRINETMVNLIELDLKPYELLFERPVLGEPMLSLVAALLEVMTTPYGISQLRTTRKLVKGKSKASKEDVLLVKQAAEMGPGAPSVGRIPLVEIMEATKLISEPGIIYKPSMEGGMDRLRKAEVERPKPGVKVEKTREVLVPKRQRFPKAKLSGILEKMPSKISEEGFLDVKDRPPQFWGFLWEPLAEVYESIPRDLFYFDESTKIFYEKVGESLRLLERGEFKKKLERYYLTPESVLRFATIEPAETENALDQATLLFESSLCYKSLERLAEEWEVSPYRMPSLMEPQRALASETAEIIFFDGLPQIDGIIENFEKLKRRVEDLEMVMGERDILVNEARFKRLIDRIAKEYRNQRSRLSKFEGGSG